MRLIHCKVTFFICNIKAFCVIEMHSRRLLYISWNYLAVCDINAVSQTDALLNSAILQFFNTYWLKRHCFFRNLLSLYFKNDKRKLYIPMSQ